MPAAGYPIHATLFCRKGRKSQTSTSIKSVCHLERRTLRRPKSKTCPERSRMEICGCSRQGFSTSDIAFIPHSERLWGVATTAKQPTDCLPVLALKPQVRRPDPPHGAQIRPDNALLTRNNPIPAASEIHARVPAAPISPSPVSLNSSSPISSARSNSPELKAES